jgi:isoleucyl-tRNA synthetase
MAPILSFTAEEAWQLAGKGDSIFLHTWHELPAVADAPALLERWNLIRNARSEVQKELETLRAAGRIGSSLQAAVEVRASGETSRALASLGDDLKFVLITSDAKLVEVPPGSEKVIASPISAPKCERCWHWRTDVGAEPSRPGLCGRCVSNLFGAGEARGAA